MSLAALGSVIFGPPLGVVEFFQARGLIPNRMSCPKCTTGMYVGSRLKCNDGYVWRCPKGSCTAIKFVNSSIVVRSFSKVFYTGPYEMDPSSLKVNYP